MRLLAASAKSLLILVCAGVLVFGTANAANTIVTAIVCSTAGSTITLSQPVSDSVVNNPNITLSGTVTQATAVAVYVDGIHRSTTNLDAIGQPFSTSVAVSAGTHEIRVTSQDICNNQDGIAIAVITYQPGAVPTQGPSVPTVTLPPTAQAPGKATGAPVDGSIEPIVPITSAEMGYGDELYYGVIDESQPLKQTNPAPGIIAIPFVVGAGAFGWIHLRRLGQ